MTKLIFMENVSKFSEFLFNDKRIIREIYRSSKARFSSKMTPIPEVSLILGVSALEMNHWDFTL